MHNQTNDLLKFIQKDTEAAGKLNTFHFWVSLTIGGTVAVVLSLFGINPSLVIARAGWPMLMLFLLAAAFLSFVVMVQSKRFSQLFFAISALAVAASFALPQWTTGFTDPGRGTAFWEQSVQCFLLGFFSSAVSATGLLTLFFNRGPIPTGAVRFSIAVLSSLVGVGVLFFHCPSSNVTHLIAGHGTQVAAMIAVSFTVVELLFVKLVRRQLKSSAIHFENLSHFDK